MSLGKLLILVALAGSVAMLIKGAPRVAAVVALAVSGLQAVMAFGYLSLGLKGIPLALILGAALAIAGGIGYVQSSAKEAVAGAALVTLVGALQVVQETKLL